MEDSKFYRDPDRPLKKIWTNVECAKYFLCLEGEVFEFKCSVGLLFDVVRQICDFKANVDNCDVTSGKGGLLYCTQKAQLVTYGRLWWLLHCTRVRY